MSADRPPRPLPNSYWATPQLLACEYPGSPNPAEACRRLDALLTVGIRDFYDLTEPDELLPYEELLRARAALGWIPPASIRYRRFPVPDMSLPAPRSLAELLAALEASAAAGRLAVVHCRGGIGRTGTVVGCFLQHTLGLSGEQALACIATEWRSVAQARRFPTSPQTLAQFDFVRSYRALASPPPAAEAKQWLRS